VTDCVQMPFQTNFELDRKSIETRFTTSQHPEN